MAMQNKFHSRNKCLLCFLKALVFWSNRLDFVAEMDVISSSLHISRRARRESTLLAANHEDESGLGELWRRFMYLSEEDVNNDHGVCSLEYLVYILLRVFSTAIIIPMWTIAGVLTFGLLWPPQIREKLMTSQISNRKEKFKAEVTRFNEVNTLKEGVAHLTEEVRCDLQKLSEDIALMKTTIESSKNEISSSMTDVKEVVSELFEMLAP